MQTKNLRAPSSLSSYKVNFFDPSKLNSEKVTFLTYDLDTEIAQFESSLVAFSEEYEKKKGGNENSKVLKQAVVGKGYVAPYNAFDLTSKGVYQGC